MALTTPEIEPGEFRAGDTTTWVKDVADYPASDGWALKYAFRNAAAKFNITCTTNADGKRYDAEISAATSAGLTAGRYDWIAYVYKAGPPVLQHTVDEGSCTVLPNLSTDANYDARSDARKNYDYLLTMYRACINVSGGQVVSYSIAGRSMTYRRGDDISLLRKELQYWAARVEAEEAEEAVANGGRNPRHVGVNFNRL